MPTQVIGDSFDISQFEHNAERNEYSQEASILIARHPEWQNGFGKIILLWDGQLLRRFEYRGMDMDGSGEDCYGWRYEETMCGTCEWGKPTYPPAKLVILND